MSDPVTLYEPLPNAVDPITVKLKLPLGDINIPGDVGDTTNFLCKDGTYRVPAGGGGGELLVATIDLDGPTLHTIDSIPVTAVTAVTGKVINPWWVASTFIPGDTTYGASAPASINVYQGFTDAGDNIFAAISIDGVFDQTVGQFHREVNFSSINPLLSDYEAVPLILQATTAITDGAGPITTLDISGDGPTGAGYAPGDTGTIDGIPGSGGTYTVLTVDGGGAPLTLALTTAGSAYTTQIDVNTTVSTGGGDGNMVVDITVLGNGTVRVNIWYTLHTVQT